jgi:hypothetical protein
MTPPPSSNRIWARTRRTAVWLGLVPLILLSLSSEALAEQLAERMDHLVELYRAISDAAGLD